MSISLKVNRVHLSPPPAVGCPSVSLDSKACLGHEPGKSSDSLWLVALGVRGEDRFLRGPGTLCGPGSPCQEQT